MIASINSRVGLALVLIILLGGMIFIGCNQADSPETENDYSRFEKAVLETSQGEIVIFLDEEKSREHSRNFLELCGTGYYDGTLFHRVVPGLLVQGGDPNSRDDDPSNDGMGGHSYRGPGTFLAGEINDLKHTRGAVSMVRGDSPESAGSQFFILLDDVPEYDGIFTVFGRVEKGMDILVEAAEQPGTPRDEGGFYPEDPLVISGCRLE